MRKDANLASMLRHRIVLQTPQLTAQNGGQFITAWQDVATVWAQVTPRQTNSLNIEALFAEKTVERISHEILLRWREDVDASMRVVFGGRYFNIRSAVNLDERGECLRLLVEENAAT